MIRRLGAWLRYNLWYFGKPPWDSGISPPELAAFIDQHPPGRALDLGCGSGTNLLTLARAGWQVTGVDFALRAALRARRRLRAAGFKARILCRDVTALDDLLPGFQLVVDIGCYHSLSAQKKQRYEQNLRRLLAEGGHLLLYGKMCVSGGLVGLVEEDISRLARNLVLVSRQEGFDRGRPSAWLLFRR